MIFVNISSKFQFFFARKLFKKIENYFVLGIMLTRGQDAAMEWLNGEKDKAKAFVGDVKAVRQVLLIHFSFYDQFRVQILFYDRFFN